MEKNYTVIKANDGRYTIGQYDEEYEAYIVNDGICNYYWWDSEAEAQLAADAYNEYDGFEFYEGLGNHGYGYDTITQDDIENYDLDTALINLYRLFHAIKD